MPARMSESFILQTYPFREADLVVSFFTRDQGKLRGVARRARRPKSSFGSGLERLSHATVSYYQKENRELVSLNSCELVHSQFTLASNYESSVALDYLAEVTEQLLPPNETNERHFRLLIAVLELPALRRQPLDRRHLFRALGRPPRRIPPRPARQRRIPRDRRRDAGNPASTNSRRAPGPRKPPPTCAASSTA